MMTKWYIPVSTKSLIFGWTGVLLLDSFLNWFLKVIMHFFDIIIEIGHSVFVYFLKGGGGIMFCYKAWVFGLELHFPCNFQENLTLAIGLPGKMGAAGVVLWGFSYLFPHTWRMPATTEIHQHSAGSLREEPDPVSVPLLCLLLQCPWSLRGQGVGGCSTAWTKRERPAALPH